VAVVWDLLKVVIGALLGCLLSQRGSDRQIRRQQVRQRVDEARKVYVECRTLALRLTGAMRRDAPGDGLTDEDLTKIDEMQRRLFDARVALDVHGATALAIALERVALDAWDLLTTARVQMSTGNQGGHATDPTNASYMAQWADMHTHLDDSQEAWERWQVDQEAVAGRWDWLRKVRGWSAWARVRQWGVWRRLRRQQPDKPSLPPDSGVS
jgi:hypothetical protein